MPAPVYRTPSTSLPSASRAVRIFAVGKNEERDKFVIITKLNEDLHLNQDVETFGYITNAFESESTDTSIFRLIVRNGNGMLDDGTEGGYDQTSNIHEKELKVGELFTVKFKTAEVELDTIFEIRSVSNY